MRCVLSIAALAAGLAAGAGPGRSAADLRRRYGVARAGFRAIRLGEDGGAGISSGSGLSAGTLLSTIDAMPVRRDGMRGR